jgi:two-component system sensor histidine kinase PhoQ
MSAPSASVARRLLISVGVPLVLFFGLTIAALDTIFRDLTANAMRDLLDEQIVALITATDLSRDGSEQLEVNLLDPESHLDLPSSGQYAAIRDDDGNPLWSSPSLEGTGLALGGRLAVGRTEFRYLTASDGSVVAELSRGLVWEYALGHTKKLVFSAATSTAPQERQLWRYRRQMLGWFSLLTLLLLATLAWRMRRALAPMRLLESEIGAVETGQLDRLSESYPRELAGVASNLNALLVAERNRIARYRDTLGNLAHTLKTPLAVIRSTLASTPPEPRTGIEREVDRMAQIIEHQLKRAAAGGGVTLGQGAVAVQAVVADLRAALLKVHARKDLVIDLDVAPGAGFVGDHGDLTELLGNLMDNACKWCRVRVQVSAAIDVSRPFARRLSVVVEDDGPGIAAADRERVLERGVRMDEEVPGHGLGLAMVRETVGLYGGRFFIDASAALGGARVEMQLPGR